MSVDSVRTAVLPLYAHFGIMPSSIELRILRRGSLSAAAAADGGGGGGGGARLSGGNGEVRLSFTHQVRLPKTLHLLNRGRVKRVRGVAYCIGVSASNNARMIEAARGVLNPLLSDVYIFSDVSAAPPTAAAGAGGGSGGGGGGGAKRRTGIGFGLSLVAESSTGALYSADVPSEPQGGQLPEDIGRRCAHQLLETIAQGGCVPLAAAPTVLILMAMGSEDLGRVVLGRDVVATPEIVGLARDLKAFGANGWGIREAEGGHARNPNPDNTGDGEDDDEGAEEDDEDDDGGGNGDIIVGIIGKGIGNVGKKIS
jgi:RNA 3'-terminal phosphate cyclase-like protein